MADIAKNKKTFKQASELIAEMFNELEWRGRTDWTGEAVFKASPAGELFHVLEYARIAKDFFELDEEERKKLKGIPIIKNGAFSFTVPETWKEYNLTEEQMKSIISLADSYKGHPMVSGIIHHVSVGNTIIPHSHAELISLANYLKGGLSDDKKEEPTTKEKTNYQEVSECPNPYVGLEWTEMFSYYGKVVARIERSMAFEWQEKDRDWRYALEEPYFVIEDTVEKAPYILTADQFKKKFSYNHDGKKCWVRFKL